MAIKAAELQVVIGADTSPAVSGIRNAVGLIGQSASTALGVFSGMLMTQAVGALRNLAAEGISAVSEFERLELTLGTLVKRDLANTGQGLDQVSSKTKELIGWVQELAKESPFDASGVVAALRTAMAYGFTADEAKRLTKATIDYAAGAGLSTDSMNQVALALGQIRAKGKLAGQEVLQLVNAGIDVRDALAKHLGITAQEVMQQMEKGAIDANTAIEAVVSTLEKDFGGAAKEQANTVSGLLSTLEELKKVGLAEFFRGALDALKPLASRLIDWAQGPGLEFLRNAGSSLGDLVTKAIAFGESATQYLQPALDWIAENGETIRGAIMGIAIAFGALVVISMVTGLVTALANPITVLIAVAGLLGAAWANNWGGIREKTAVVVDWLKGAFKTVRSWLSTNIPAALDTLKSMWQTAWPVIRSVVSAVVDWLTGAFETVRSWLSTNIPAALDTLKSMWQTAWPVIRSVVSAVVDWLTGAFETVRSWLSTNIPAALDALKSTWQTVWPAIQSVVSAVLSIIQSIWQAFRAAFEGDWYTFGAKLREAWDALWKLLVQIVQNAWSAIQSAVKSLIDSVIDFFRRTDWAAVGRAIVDGIARGITAGASAIANAAKNAAKAALDAAKGFLGIKSPSKVFEQQIADNMMAGWVRGIQRMTPQLELAVAGASSRAVQAATINNYYNLSVQSVRSAEQIERDFWLMRG